MALVAVGGGGMVAETNGQTYEYVAIDLNTQNDFCERAGAFPVSNLESLLPALRRIIAWTKRNGIPVVSAIASHRASDMDERHNGHYSTDGSYGQQKVGFTLFCDCERIEVDNTLTVPLDVFREHQQVIFRKRTDDLLSNPKADRFFTQLSVGEFVLFGNAVECSVKALALGLLARNKRVTIVTDCCGYWNHVAADLAVRQMLAKGVRITTMDELKKRRIKKRTRYAGRNGHDHESRTNGRAYNGQGKGGGNGHSPRNGNGHPKAKDNGHQSQNGHRNGKRSLHSPLPTDHLSTDRTDANLGHSDGNGFEH